MKDIADVVEEYLALRRTGSADRTRFINSQDPSLRDEIAGLLAAVDEVEDLGQSARQQKTTDFEVPERLGDFHLKEFLGAGGMGLVFAAIQAGLNRRVAVKVLSPSLAMDPHTRERFAAEASIVARLRHEHIVPILANGQEGPWCWFAMELIDGVGLDHLLLGESDFSCPLLQLPRDVFVAEIGLQAAQALAYAHRNQVLHRDVKPANILLDRSGKVLLADFGLATAIDDAGLEAGVSQLRAGTLRFTAPERLSGRGGPAADQYSLGITLYELAGGRPAFDQADTAALTTAITKGELPRLSGIAADLATIIATAIATDPASRYPSMEALCQDLERFLKHEPILARPPSMGKRLCLWAKRKPLTAASIAASLSIIVGLNIALIGSQGNLKRTLQEEQRHRVRASTHAAIAAEALDRLFAHFSALPSLDGGGGTVAVSPKHAQLLESLIAQFEALAQDSDAGLEGQRRLARAHLILGHCKWRLGEGSAALKHYKQAKAGFLLLGDAVSLALIDNLYAAVVSDQGQRDQALALWRQVADKGQASQQRPLQEQALTALLWMLTRPQGLPGMPGPDRTQEPDPILGNEAADLLTVLWKQDNSGEGIRFALATLLSRFPQVDRRFRDAGLPVDRRAIMYQLLNDHPDNLNYHLETARLESQVNLHQQIRPEEMTALFRAAAHADILIARWSAESEAVSLAIDIYDKLASACAGNGDNSGALRQLVRAEDLLAMLLPKTDDQPLTTLRIAKLRLRRVEILLADSQVFPAKQELGTLQADLKKIPSTLPALYSQALEHLQKRCADLIEQSDRPPRPNPLRNPPPPRRP